MLLKIICIICISNTFSSFSDALPVADNNEDLLRALETELSKLRAIPGLEKEYLNGILNNVHYIKTEQDRQRQLIDGLAMKSDIPSRTEEQENITTTPKARV